MTSAEGPVADLKGKMMTAHTPGPWQCRDADTGNYFSGEGSFLVMVPGRDYRGVARTPTPIHGIPWSREESQANARLIAAAPDLLEACKAMADAMCPCDTEQGCDECVIDDARMACKVAIAKAEDE